MQFDPNNPIVKLCAEGMNLEGEGKMEEAAQLFQQARNEAITDFEKFTSAHYVARHQKTVSDKLKWDETALSFALKTTDSEIREVLPSLYLNIGKCHEDLCDFSNARKHYEQAQSFAELLPDDGYIKMIRTGIANGLDRVKENS